MNQMMSLTYIVSKYLQKELIDLSSAILKIELVQQRFSEMRKEGDKQFLQLYRGAEDMGEKLEANNPEEYYRRSIFYPYIDEISSSLTERFTSHKDVLIGLDSVLPCNIQQRQFTDLEPASLDFYQSDLVHTNRDILNAEWELWKSHWKIDQVTPKTATSVLKALKDEDDAFPNMKILLGILAVLPVTTASVERSFSTLKRLKTYLRNSIGEERLTSLVLLSIHRGLQVKTEEIIYQYTRTPRRLQFH
uniref:52 kDa repressor of the inhibitor of the protein kinase-like n=1 Tax=Diabrotica virgifera virgifera TaxID=50390 RepID=A0A6P7G201_DIAVI